MGLVVADVGAVNVAVAVVVVLKHDWDLAAEQYLETDKMQSSDLARTRMVGYWVFVDEKVALVQ